MRIGVYGLPGYPTTAALASGLAAVGHRVVWRRASVFTADQMEREFEAVAVYGLHKGEGDVARAYASRGVPVIVADLPHLRRDVPGAQLGLGRCGWLPPFPCSTDRWRALEIPVAETASGGESVLLVGQRPKDAGHGLGDTGYQAWLDHAVTMLRAHTDQPIVFRPHPRDLQARPTVPVDAIQGPDVPVGEALRLARAVVTHSSTVGTEALVAGVPVLCDPWAMYADWAETDLTRVASPRVATLAERQDYLARLGYAQWTLAELADGTAARFITGVLHGEIPVPPAPQSVVVGGPIANFLDDAPIVTHRRRARRAVR